MRAITCAILFSLATAAPAEAAFNLHLDAPPSYDTHFHPGDTISFSVKIRNDEPTAQFAEVDITLVNSRTGVEFTLVPVLTQTVPAGQTVTLSRTYNLASDALAGGATRPVTTGTYTVSFPLFDGNGDRCEQVRGKFPLHVGTETESVRVFPEILDLGTIPAGRTMHPTPIEVTWSYFRFNQLRKDQPFAIRIYSDNAARFLGFPKALRKTSPAGLVSLDGRYTIPLKVWTLNFGPDIQETGWDGPLAGPPPVEEDDYWIGPPLLEGSRALGSANWVRIPDLTEMTANPVTWRRLIGQDQYDDRFVGDSNPTGDFTLRSPFTFYLATEAGAAAPAGNYSTTLIVELWTP